MLASNDAVTRQECVRAVVFSGGHGHVCLAQSRVGVTFLQRKFTEPAMDGRAFQPGASTGFKRQTLLQVISGPRYTGVRAPCAAQEVPLAVVRIGIDERLPGFDRWLRVSLPEFQSSERPVRA